jgi:hypothetical protein
VIVRRYQCAAKAIAFKEAVTSVNPNRVRSNQTAKTICTVVTTRFAKRAVMGIVVLSIRIVVILTKNVVTVTARKDHARKDQAL